MSSILLLGGDGYTGWPLCLKLARRYPEREIVVVDNFTRRRLVEEVGGNSLLPVRSMPERLEALRRIYDLNNVVFYEFDVNSPRLEEVLREHKPDIIYHLAQQASAGYSMKGVDEALFTIQNNELGNMRLLWSIRCTVPHAHLIKLGSFGEYAKTGLEIAEGYFFPEYKGQKATVKTPYPRKSDDIYHITKINDTNFIAMACEQWGMKITDIMQATIVGTQTEEIQDHPELFTRFDYDSTFGTVLNRFMAQVLCKYPLTIYGSGHQRTGLMHIEDSMTSLVNLAESVPDAGEHRVINHVTEQRYSINEIADMVKLVAERKGHSVDFLRGEFDPRV